ncbi:MAG: ribose ABC transporter [Proteobacteria bacterium]|nr:ribose ABC transporter [Pseudomonadota bacterium]
MLKGIDPLLGPELLQALAAMGHGDQIAVVDANFPAAAGGGRLVRLDGADTPTALRAVLTLLPIDNFVKHPAAVMRIDKGYESLAVPIAEFQRVLDAAHGGKVAIARLDRQAFYDRARAAFVVVITGEPRYYGNIVVAKGAIPPASRGAGRRRG